MSEFSVFCENPPFTEEELFRSLRLPLEEDSEETDVVREMMETAMPLAAPKVMWKLSPAKEENGALWLGDKSISSPYVLEKLRNQALVVPYVATCGRELEEWSKKITDPLEEYIADGIKVFYLYNTFKAFLRFLGEKVLPVGKISTLNPGSLGAWPISGQEELFAVLGDVTGTIGVELNRDWLMIPTKSSSGIAFAAEESYHNCSFCPRTDCPNRSAPFTGMAL